VTLLLESDPSRAPEDDKVTVGDMFACGPDAASFEFPDFSSHLGLTASGDAALNGTEFWLIPGGANKAGAVWSAEKLPVVRGFVATFTVTTSDSLDKSDGFTFVLQNDSPTPALSAGGNMGYSGFGSCLAVEVDGIHNESQNDPSGNHVALMESGSGSNADHDVAEIERGALSGGLIGLTVPMVIAYDAQEQTFQVTVDGDLKIDMTNFDLSTYPGVDEDGLAWVGIIATAGPEPGNGETILHDWTLGIPAGCRETSIWVEPIDWNSSGYAGVSFDHQILDPSLRQGMTIKEQVKYISDSIGGLSETGLIALEDNDGLWSVQSTTKHGIQGNWRNSVDGHWINIQLYPNLKAFFDAGGEEAEVIYKQEMKELVSGRVFASHKLIMKFVKIHDGDPCYITIVGAHAVVEKGGTYNQDVWPGLPTISCPP